MAENEAPEKLYIFNPEKRKVWFSKTSNKQVEYTRTDVFIEKVLDFFENKVCCYIRAQDFTIEHGRLEEDFKEYIKDEELWKNIGYLQ